MGCSKPHLPLEVIELELGTGSSPFKKKNTRKAPYKYSGFFDHSYVTTPADSRGPNRGFTMSDKIKTPEDREEYLEMISDLEHVDMNKIHESMTEILLKDREQEEEERAKAWDIIQVGDCMVCDGPVMRHPKHRPIGFDTLISPSTATGPAGYSFDCDECGLMYSKPPPPKTGLPKDIDPSTIGASMDGPYPERCVATKSDGSRCNSMAEIGSLCHKHNFAEEQKGTKKKS